MSNEDLLLHRILAIASALAYWVGVLVQARRVRRRIGRSPNVKPRGARERLLWAGWTLVVLSWLGLPLVVGTEAASPALRVLPPLCGLLGSISGILLLVAGYAGTLWCYVAMGNMWRMGVNRNEKTLLVEHGPFQYVRHPIYILQTVMLAGVALLLPAPIWLAIIVIHFLCIVAKAADEERHLLSAHGKNYGDYVSRTGRFFPKLRPTRNHE
jgi:protein-S-isoprenylcysteine O-methyltransferase Ste14